MSTTITRRAASPCIARHRIRERDAARRDFQVELLEGETFEDALRPEFLGAKADVFAPGDRIAVVGHELAFWGELIVIETDEALAAVKVVPLIGPIDLKSRIAEALPFDVIEGADRAARARQLAAEAGQRSHRWRFQVAEGGHRAAAEIKAGPQGLAAW